MFYYCLYELNVCSEISLPVLLPGREEQPYDVQIDCAPLPPDISASIAAGNGIGFGKQICWLHTEYGTFVIAQGNRITVSASPDTEVWQLRPFILGFGFATLFLQRGIPAFHCSTVSYFNNAYIFAGLSGSGKSTTTASFMDKGALMMADDMIIATKKDDGYYALPAYPQQKLCRDAALRQGYQLETLSLVSEERDKYAVKCKERFCFSPKQIKAFFYLEPADVKEVSVAKVEKQDSLNLLTKNLFLAPSLRITGIPDFYLIPCIHFSLTVPIYKVCRPLSGKNTTEEVFQAITEIIDTL